MPIMVPQELLEDTPQSEKIVFERLKSSWHARAWRVYHSVYVDNLRNPTRPREIDFVVCIPEYNAIICLEAKGGRYRTIDGGNRWHNLHSGEVQQPSPPEQARTAMFALKNELERLRVVRRDVESYISFGCAVALPDGNFPEGATLPRQALTLEQLDINNPIKLTQKIKNYAYALGRKEARDEDELRVARLEFNAAIDYLEREEEMQSATITSGYLETVRELLRLTPEQQASQAITASNDRCIIDGAAGTGKTVLAKELARRLCEDNGESVAFLCSNSVFVNCDLQDWMETLSSDKGGRIAVGTPATLPLYAFDGNDAAQRSHERRLAIWSDLEGTLKLGGVHEDWQAFIADTLQDLPQGGVFDYLVIDEAQNLCAEPFFSLFDKLLKGGIVNGRWTMFGDFVNQNIVSPSINNGLDGKDALKARYENISWVNYPLSTNCRNTQDIALETYKLVRIDAPTIPGVRGPDVEFDYFSSQQDLGDILDRLVDSWKRNGVESFQIILLTSDKDGDFDTTRTYGGWNLANIREMQGGRSDATLRYSDIYDFQGLESDVVILVLPVTDEQAVVGGVVTLPNENHMRRMFYIGMSRARTVLIIVADESYRESLELRRELFDELR